MLTAKLAVEAGGMDLADGATLPPGEEFDGIRKSLAKAVLHFQNEFLRSDFNKGSLCQVHLRQTVIVWRRA